MGKAKKVSAGAANVSTGSGVTRTTATGNVAQLLDRPSLREHLPPLTAFDVVPEQPGFIVVVEDVLSPGECARLIAAMDAPVGTAAACGIALQPSTAADLRPKKNEALLNRDSCAVLDEALAAQLWERILPVLPEVPGRRPVGLVGDGRMGDITPNQVKFYRYQRGHSFGLHVDLSRKGPMPGEATEYTLLFYLNSQGEAARSGADGDAGNPLVGGDTIFMATAKTELCRVSPKAGAALLHAHGQRCLLHEGELVSKGAKYLMRADVLYAAAS